MYGDVSFTLLWLGKRFAPSFSDADDTPCADYAMIKGSNIFYVEPIGDVCRGFRSADSGSSGLRGDLESDGGNQEVHWALG